MKLPELVPGRFIRRDNRFRATVKVGGEEVWAHVPNSGKLTDLFQSGRPVWLAPAAAPHRKTAFDLMLVELPSGLVSADARLPNPLFAEALKAGRVAGFDYAEVEREVAVGASRIDFRLSGPPGECWVETKSVTLVEDGVALFPDVPTARGSRHLQELMALKSRGMRAAVVFVIQRQDAGAFAPHERVDPLFASTLREAMSVGVEVRALLCKVTFEEITISDIETPVVAGPV